MPASAKERFESALRRLRCAVAFYLDMEPDSMKRLRAELVMLSLQHTALVRLLMEKRQDLTAEEYDTALALAAEDELERYREKLKARTGADIDLEHMT